MTNLNTGFGRTVVAAELWVGKATECSELSGLF